MNARVQVMCDTAHQPACARPSAWRGTRRRGGNSGKVSLAWGHLISRVTRERISLSAARLTMCLLVSGCVLVPEVEVVKEIRCRHARQTFPEFPPLQGVPRLLALCLAQVAHFARRCISPARLQACLCRSAGRQSGTATERVPLVCSLTQWCPPGLQPSPAGTPPSHWSLLYGDVALRKHGPAGSLPGAAKSGADVVGPLLASLLASGSCGSVNREGEGKE